MIIKSCQLNDMVNVLKWTFNLFIMMMVMIIMMMVIIIMMGRMIMMM